MAVAQAQVQIGAHVYGSDGIHVGVVKAVRGNDFLVDRKLHRDVYIPFDAVRDVIGDQIALVICASEVGHMGWEHPPLLGESVVI